MSIGLGSTSEARRTMGVFWNFCEAAGQTMMLPSKHKVVNVPNPTNLRFFSMFLFHYYFQSLDTVTLPPINVRLGIGQEIDDY
jgi:hypothetical protein